MPRLVPCPECACHVKREDKVCTHCGALIHAKRMAPTGAALLLGLTTINVSVVAVSCSNDEDNSSSSTTATTRSTTTIVTSTSFYAGPIIGGYGGFDGYGGIGGVGGEGGEGGTGRGGAGGQ